ncbi:MAG TPA: hypothetical protein VIN40_08480 [Candidatus Tyrphobacter sp.]
MNPLLWETWRIPVARIGCVAVTHAPGRRYSVVIHSDTIQGVQDTYMPNPVSSNPFRNSGLQRVRFWQSIEISGVTQRVAAQLLQYRPIATKRGQCADATAMYHLRFVSPSHRARIIASYTYQDSGDMYTTRLATDGRWLFDDEDDLFSSIGRDHELGEIRLGSIRCVRLMPAGGPDGVRYPSLEIYPVIGTGIVWRFLLDTSKALRGGKGTLTVDDMLPVFFASAQQQHRVWDLIRQSVPALSTKSHSCGFLRPAG